MIFENLDGSLRGEREATPASKPDKTPQTEIERPLKYRGNPLPTMRYIRQRLANTRKEFGRLGQGNKQVESKRRQSPSVRTVTPGESSMSRET